MAKKKNELMKELETQFIDIGKYLKECQDDERYKPTYSTYPEFLMELKISHFQMMQL